MCQFVRMHGARLLLRLSAALGAFALTGSAAAQECGKIVDATFVDAEWSHVEVVDTNGTATFSVMQDTAGGNPPPRQRGSHTYTNTIVREAHMYLPALHDPAFDGVISWVVFDIDFMHESFVGPCGAPSPELKLRGCLLQGGEYYTYSFPAYPVGGWEDHQSGALVETDFGQITASGVIDFGVNPDFSTSGAPIQFGYASSNSTGTGPCTATWGVDNFQVEVTSVGSCSELTTLPDVAINASVVPSGGGTAQAAQIGTLDVSAGAGSVIEASFTLEPAYAYLDDCYDFRWVNVERCYEVAGVAQSVDPVVGLLPAIDPSPSDGAEPYYYNALEWSSGFFGASTVRQERVLSKFIDARSDRGLDSTIDFRTYLVANDTAQGNLANKTFCVLGGFAWSYDNTTGDALICGALDADASIINLALAKGQKDCPGHAGCPGFAGWTAIEGCELGPCELLKVSPQTLSVSAGGTQTLQLDASAKNVGLPYGLFGTISGSTPGVALGPYNLPLTLDVYFTITLTSPTPELSGSIGILNVNGQATATFSLPSSSNPALAGLTLEHAYLVLDGLGGVHVVSGPAALLLVP